MRTRRLRLHTALLLAVLVTGPAWAARDPFWPVGYAPALPSPQEPVVQAEPAPPPPPGEKPISDSDWAKARKALPISGFTKSFRPDTQETRALVMINRQTYAAGDTVRFVWEDVRFLWRVEAVTDKEVLLTPVRAERVAPTNLNPNL